MSYLFAKSFLWHVAHDVAAAVAAAAAVARVVAVVVRRWLNVFLAMLLEAGRRTSWRSRGGSVCLDGRVTVQGGCDKVPEWGCSLCVFPAMLTCSRASVISDVKPDASSGGAGSHELLQQLAVDRRVQLSPFAIRQHHGLAAAHAERPSRARRQWCGLLPAGVRLRRPGRSWHTLSRSCS